MKKAILILTLAIGSFTQVFSQHVSAVDFIGHWTCDKTSVEMIIWKDKHGDFQVVRFDKSNGEMLECTDLTVKKAVLTFTTRTLSTNAVINSTFTLVDDTHLSELIAADMEYEAIQLFWKKLK